MVDPAVGRLMKVQEEERRQLAALIHDDSIQIMAAAYLRLQMLRRRLTTDADRDACEALEQTVKLAVQSLQRLILDLKPAALDRGLAGALADYLGQVELHTEVVLRLVDGLSTEPGDENRLILYRGAQEAVARCLQQAPASHITVALSEDPSGYTLRVGSGPGEGALPFTQQRAEAVGGSCRVDPSGEATIWVPRDGPPPEPRR